MTDVAVVGANFAYGFGIGYALGYFVKKAIKVFMAILGLYVASLYYLAEKGVITINTDKLNQVVGEAANRIYVTFYSVGYAAANGLGVVAGFALGFSRG